MKHKPLPLTENEVLKLEEIARKSADWRSRDRAKTLLLLSRGVSVRTVTEEQGICKKTVYERRQLWLDKGFASLVDAHRKGAPSKLSACLLAIEAWAQAEPMTVSDVQKRLKEEFDVVVHANTVSNTLKNLGFVWKRTRYSLKKT
jgi:transposase